MLGRDLSSGIDSIYQAGSTAEDWASAGNELFRLLDVESGTLRVQRPDGSSVNLLRPHSPQDPVYLKNYLRRDPLRKAAERIRPTEGWLTAVKRTEDLISRDDLLRSDFYQNYARPNGQIHMLVGSLGDSDRTVISFFRESTTFGEHDKARLAVLLPHVRRAVQLHKRLALSQLTASVGEAALGVAADGVFLLDSNASILFANEAAERMLKGAGCPFLVRSHRTERGVGLRQLALGDHGKSSRFRALVGNASKGGDGGAMRLEIDEEYGQRHLAVIVTPKQHQAASDASTCSRQGLVLVYLKNLARAGIPSPALLSDLFGLSIAESAVGVALLGGHTAENVARQRNVSLETVRSQIRTVLRKTEAANLRDFERIGALLATFGRGR